MRLTIHPSSQKMEFLNVDISQKKKKKKTTNCNVKILGSKELCLLDMQMTFFIMDYKLFITSNFQYSLIQASIQTFRKVFRHYLLLTIATVIELQIFSI